MTSRRSLIFSGLSGLTLSMAGARASFAQTGASNGKFVLIILRGAMDGLSAIVPYQDPNYARMRAAIALPQPGQAGGVLPLGEGFGLHPALSGLHGLWQSRQMSFMHAAASPYRDRSHFDGQDMLESGAGRLYGSQSGWLNRAIALLPNGPSKEGIGIGSVVPLVLRGSAKSGSWAPAIAEQTNTDTLNRLIDLYSGDPLLGPALAMAIETDQTASSAMMNMENGGGRRAINYVPLSQSAARLLSAPQGPSACVLSFDGWDTHANQGASTGQLATRFAQLDAAIMALKAGLGTHWSQTTVVVATEFGRTARVNGTNGTDHGTGGAGFILGGAVRGGAMLGDWPGLGTLHEDRDLIPANDIRDLFTLGLSNAWGLEREALRAGVFSV